jgi:nucleoid DNA-binding protein
MWTDEKYIKATAAKLNLPETTVYAVIRSQYAFVAEAMKHQENVKVAGWGIFRIKPKRKEFIEIRKAKQKLKYDTNSIVQPSTLPAETDTEIVETEHVGVQELVESGVQNAN